MLPEQGEDSPARAVGRQAPLRKGSSFLKDEPDSSAGKGTSPRDSRGLRALDPSFKRFLVSRVTQ